MVANYIMLLVGLAAHMSTHRGKIGTPNMLFLIFDIGMIVAPVSWSCGLMIWANWTITIKTAHFLNQRQQRKKEKVTDGKQEEYRDVSIGGEGNAER